MGPELCFGFVASKFKSVSTVIISLIQKLFRGFPGGIVVKNPPAYVGDAGSIPGS